MVFELIDAEANFLWAEGRRRKRTEEDSDGFLSSMKKRKKPQQQITSLLSEDFLSSENDKEKRRVFNFPLISIKKSEKQKTATEDEESRKISMSNLEKNTSDYQIVPVAERKERRINNRLSVTNVTLSILTFVYMLFNIFVLSVFSYLICYFIYYFRKDFIQSINVRRFEVEKEIEFAKKAWELNRCDPSSRVPAMEEMCNGWEKTIRGGFFAMNYLQLIIEILGDCINTFISHFSYKSLFTITAFLFILHKFRQK